MKNVILPMISKMMPSLIAQQIIGVQPMTTKAANVFRIKSTPQDPNIVKFHKKYRFSRAKWHEATISFKDGPAIWEWCTERFGKQDKNPDAWSRWYIAINTIRFRDEKDYLMFLLRWGV
jgi:hypothetical protein